MESKMQPSKFHPLPIIANVDRKGTQENELTKEEEEEEDKVWNSFFNSLSPEKMKYFAKMFASLPDLAVQEPMMRLPAELKPTLDGIPLELVRPIVDLVRNSADSEENCVGRQAGKEEARR